MVILYESVMCMTHDEYFHSLTLINRIVILNKWLLSVVRELVKI